MLFHPPIVHGTARAGQYGLIFVPISSPIPSRSENSGDEPGLNNHQKIIHGAAARGAVQHSQPVPPAFPDRSKLWQLVFSCGIKRAGKLQNRAVSARMLTAGISSTDAHL